MTIRPDNISIDIDIINSIREELKPISDRENFLNTMIQRRLQKCNKDYLDNIDSQVDKLLEEVEDIDINGMMRVINKVSKGYSDLYVSQISLYKILQSLE